MMRFAGIFLSLVFATSLNSLAETKSEETPLREIPQAFCLAWAKHDGHELAKIMSEDVDFVTVGAVWLHGRADFEKYHVRLLGGRFKDSTNTPLETAVRFLRPDLAAIHWSWRITGDRDYQGALRKPRYGMMVMIAEKVNGSWQVVVAQNTNNAMGKPPELTGIQPPIVVPTSEN
jgi:uncharacterized protein (TIGR02246 family)